MAPSQIFCKQRGTRSKAATQGADQTNQDIAKAQELASPPGKCNVFSQYGIIGRDNKSSTENTKNDTT
jgi:hypothetical protein